MPLNRFLENPHENNIDDTDDLIKKLKQYIDARLSVQTELMPIPHSDIAFDAVHTIGDTHKLVTSDGKPTNIPVLSDTGLVQTTNHYSGHDYKVWRITSKDDVFGSIPSHHALDKNTPFSISIWYKLGNHDTTQGIMTVASTLEGSLLAVCAYVKEAVVYPVAIRPFSNPPTQNPTSYPAFCHFSGAISYNLDIPKPGKWYNEVTTYDGQIARTFINGELRYSITRPYNFSDISGPFNVAINFGYIVYINSGGINIESYVMTGGELGNIEFYNQCLTKTSVKALYEDDVKLVTNKSVPHVHFFKETLSLGASTNNVVFDLLHGETENDEIYFTISSDAITILSRGIYSIVISGKFHCSTAPQTIKMFFTIDDIAYGTVAGVITETTSGSAQEFHSTKNLNIEANKIVKMRINVVNINLVTATNLNISITKLGI